MRNLIGIVIILLGLGFLAQELDLPNADRLLDLWWPSIVIAIGLLMWSSNRRMWFGPFVIVLIGAVMLLDRFDVLTTSAWNLFWPIVVIVVGARMLMGRTGTPGVKQEQAADANITVFFSGADKKVGGRVTSTNVTAWFGGAKLDLRTADIADGAVISINAALAGVDILIPPGVNIKSDVMPLFGGVEDKSDHSNARVTLRLDGFAMFGGIGIKN